jgi:predicted SnoaL-like aldol condensation-catalyzing enzyme
MADAETNKQTVVAAQSAGSRRPRGVHRLRPRFAGQFPELNLEIKRVIAEGDLVVTHGLIKTSPDDRGLAAADIFRLEDGKIVEHWDVVQPVPETAANDNTMF